jgi:glycosyltransferase involved in cell wall biosynthesis
MRIGVDATSWANQRGYGRFTREITRAMIALAPTDEFVFILDSLSASQFDPDGPNVRKLIVSGLKEAPVRAASAGSNRSIVDMWRMTRATKAAKLDAFFSPTVYTYFPLPRKLPAVVTIHDMIPERFPDLTLPSKRARLFWRLKVGLAIRQARKILTVSEYSARDISQLHRIPADRITVATEAPSSEYYPDEGSPQSAIPGLSNLKAETRWFTYVGGFNPHKNVVGLVRAHAALARKLGDAAPALLLVGNRESDDFFSDVPAIEAAIDAAGTMDLVHWTGYVEDQVLRRIHSRSLALVLPSDAEGFGLPAIEAAACGSPIIATSESPLPGLLPGAGFFVVPRDEKALLEAMRAIAADSGLRTRCGTAALAGARALSWETAASAALGAIRDAAA